MECYYKWCQFHEYQKLARKSEPLCRLEQCIAPRHEMEYFAIMREQELEISELQRKLKEVTNENK